MTHQEFLRAYRKEHKLTCADMAEKINIHVPAYKLWEHPNSVMKAIKTWKKFYFIGVTIPPECLIPYMSEAVARFLRKDGTRVKTVPKKRPAEASSPWKRYDVPCRRDGVESVSGVCYERRCYWEGADCSLRSLPVELYQGATSGSSCKWKAV